METSTEMFLKKKLGELALKLKNSKDQNDTLVDENRELQKKLEIFKSEMGKINRQNTDLTIENSILRNTSSNRAVSPQIARPPPRQPTIEDLYYASARQAEESRW